MPIEQDIEVTYTPGEVDTQSIPGSHIEINDLIGNPPGWLLRSGITMVAIVTTIILIGSYYFKYPDKLTGMGLVTSTNPPIEIISRTTGYIDVIHFEGGSEVNQGEALIYINNTTDQAQLIQLQEWIKQYEKINDSKDYLQLSFIGGLQLGTVQNEYANLQLRFNELQQTLKEDVVFQQINNLSREIIKINSLNESQQREKEIYAQELNLTKKDYKRNENLKNDGAISTLDLERAKASLLQSERQYEGMNNTIIQNNIRIEQLELEKLKLREQRSNEIKGYLFSISELIARIRSSIENWNNTYSITSPIEGKITYVKDITLKKNLNQGDVIGYIIPNNSLKNYVSAIFPSNNIGKIEKGQKVILKFDAYPHKEYGIVESSVNEISKLPEMNLDGELQYEIRILLEDVIVTDFNDTLPYNPKMTVIADVITEDKTIFERLFKQFLSLINQ